MITLTTRQDFKVPKNYLLREHLTNDPRHGAF